MCMPGTHRGQKRAQNPLELELWVVSSHCRWLSPTLCKSSKGYLSAPDHVFFSTNHLLI
ncbi:hypothetical protein I79_007496 [Cricetulus griseus]|uniref:Uncharacterized protein n=1 Tax=Cricetulus griseus TaxID=10029 RepID=G3HAP0_CRIGR|nr:hypothetical protein I79_007496 [Cricetulus griseus]